MAILLKNLITSEIFLILILARAISSRQHGQLFNLTTDQILNFDDKIPKEITIEDKTAVEQMRLLQQLYQDDKKTVFKIIDKMLTTKKFKDFFNKNVATL